MIYYFLSRLGSTVLSPFGFIFSILFFQLFVNKRILTIISILTIYISSIPITSKILWKNLESPWKRLEISQVKKADSIVILSGGGVYTLENNLNYIDWNDSDRFIAGINLFKLKKAEKIIFTNGPNTFRKNIYLEGNIYANEAKKLGIPIDAIITTGKVNNTLDEAKMIKKYFSNFSNHNNDIILVTSAFHMKRAKGVFERHSFNVTPYPVDFKIDYSKKISYSKLINYIPSPTSFYMTCKVFREILGRIVYRTI